MHRVAVPSPAAVVHSQIVAVADKDDELHHISPRNNLDRPAVAASFRVATKAQKKGRNHKENQEEVLYSQDAVDGAAGFVGHGHEAAVEPAGPDRVADAELKTQGVHYHCESAYADQKAATTITVGVLGRGQVEART